MRGVCSPMSDSVKPTTLRTAVRFTIFYPQISLMDAD
jgi:hypothetical protein